MDMSQNDPLEARRTLETIINCLRPTNPYYIRSFIAIRGLPR